VLHNLYSFSVYSSLNSDGSSPTTVIEDSVSPTFSYPLESGYYVNVVVKDAASTIITNSDLAYNSSTWYLVDRNMTFTITPDEGFKITYSLGGGSGAGNQRFTIAYGDNYNNLSNSIKSTSYSGSEILKSGVYFSITPSEFKGAYEVEDSGEYNVKVTKTTYDANKKGTTVTLKDDSTPSWDSYYLLDGDYSFKISNWGTSINPNLPCVTAGTLINMADGTIKKVEEVKTGDQVLVFNHLTGKFDTSIVMYNAHDKEEWKHVDIINLVFDNGQTVKMVTEHAFFNLTLNEYSVFTKENVESFIGDEFFVLQDLYSINKSSSKLIDVYYTNEFTGVYSPVTANGLNCFTDGFLSIAGDFKGFYNIFEFDENQKYDEELMNQDIEKYGLFTYEDFKEYVPEILFDAYQGQYLKISIGKGHTTFEEILQLIDKYINDEKLPDDFINMFPK